MSNLADNELLLKEYMKLKDTERTIKERKVQIEAELMETFGPEFPEEASSKSFREGKYKIKISRNITYKANEKVWAFIDNMKGEKPIKIELDQTKAKKISELLPLLDIHETKPSFEVVIG